MTRGFVYDRHMRILIALVVALAACSGDEVDRICTKAFYDPCVSEHDCDSNNCQTFGEGDAAFQACTMSCTDATGCPDGGVCTDGLCAPPEPNSCELP